MDERFTIELIEGGVSIADARKRVFEAMAARDAALPGRIDRRRIPL